MEIAEHILEQMIYDSAVSLGVPSAVSLRV